MPSNLDQVIAALGEGLTSVHTQVRHGDKSVTFRATAELRDAVKLADELDNPPATLIVAQPRRPKL